MRNIVPVDVITHFAARPFTGHHPSNWDFYDLGDLLIDGPAFTRTFTNGNVKEDVVEHYCLRVGTAPLYDHPTNPITEQVFFVELIRDEGGARGSWVNRKAVTEELAYAWYFALCYGVVTGDEYVKLVPGYDG